jgi:hypothetical protein
LADALELVFLLRDDDRRLEQAALRWHSRLVAEGRLGLDEAQAVWPLLGTFVALGLRRPAVPLRTVSTGPVEGSTRPDLYGSWEVRARRATGKEPDLLRPAGSGQTSSFLLPSVDQRE